MSEDSPIVITLKAPGAAGPWIVLRSETPDQASAQLSGIEAGGLLSQIGQVQSSFEAQYNAGHILGARSENPVPTYPQQATQAQLPAQPAWGAPDAQPVWSQPQQAAPQVVNNYQAPQQQFQQPAAPSIPGAPLIAGQPAKLVSGEKNGRSWQAWADPRPKEMTQNLPKTDNPNDPRLAQGMASFWAFVK